MRQIDLLPPVRVFLTILNQIILYVIFNCYIISMSFACDRFIHITGL